MTDTHTADTDYQQQDEGQYHHEVRQRDVPASLTIKPAAPIPHGPRGWPLGARLAVAVLIIGLTTVATMSLLMLHKVSVSAANASQTAVAEQGTVTQLRHEIADIQIKISVPAPVFHLPAIYQHYGVCVSFGRNTANGDLVDVNLTAPVVQAGSYTCGQGSFVSVVPAP